MNVILQSRMNLFHKPGGDTKQIVDLKKGLKEHGLDVTISTDLNPCLTEYDIVHLFNLTRVHETYLQMANAKKQRKPVVCSTIYHVLSEYNRIGRYGISGKIFKLLGNDEHFEYVRGLLNILRNKSQLYPVARQWLKGYRFQQAMVLKISDKIVFGSLAEKRAVFSDFPEIAQSINYDIIRIGVTKGFHETDSISFERKFGLKNFILCVGRIEDLKNQLGLICAMAGISIPVVFIGDLNRAHSSYCRKVLARIENSKSLYFFGPLGRDMLNSAYSAARVHVLPSWFETTGLVSLEAGLAGCNIVSTNRGYAMDYLKDYAWYCDPSKLPSIANAVQTAYDSDNKTDLKDYILEELNINIMIKRLIKLYRELAIKKTNDES